MVVVTPGQFKVPMDSSEITLESVPAVSEIAAADWDACANPAPSPARINALDAPGSPDVANEFSAGSKAPYNPFISHAFFSALEASNSACARTGWGPRHLLARVDGDIAGVVPCYLKSHSQGDKTRTPRGGGQRHYHPRAHRQRDNRGRLGRVFRVLHGDGFAKMGPPLSDPRILLAGRRKHG